MARCERRRLAFPLSHAQGTARAEQGRRRLTGAPGAPDITSVVVRSDASETITFQVHISNRPVLSLDMFVQVYIDSDDNPATGDPYFHADYLLQFAPGGPGFRKWTGTGFFSDAAPDIFFRHTYSNGVATFQIKASDPGITKAFNFGVITVSGVHNQDTLDIDTARRQEEDEMNLTNLGAVLSLLKRDAAPDAGHDLFHYSL